jgi:nucleoside-diphosphate-sugar epimerase
MRVLVIGGTRFIGLALVRALAARGHVVAVFNRGRTLAAAGPNRLPEGVQQLTGDVAQLVEARAAFAAFAPDVIVHNIVMHEGDARALLEVARGLVPRVVMTSSMDVYQAYGWLTGTEPGEPPEMLATASPADETAPLRTALYPLHSYDKLPAERLVLASSEPRATVLRLPMVYGEADPQRRFLPFVHPICEGREVIVLDAAYAGWRSAYGYVENVAHALLLACEDARAAGRVYNVGDMTPAMLELGQRVAASTGWPGRFVLARAEDLPETLRAGMDTRAHLAFSSAQLTADLGYTAPIDDTTAIARTVAWEREQPHDLSEQYRAEDSYLAAHSM